jgi:hypothetical protein
MIIKFLGFIFFFNLFLLCLLYLNIIQENYISYYLHFLNSFCIIYFIIDLICYWNKSKDKNNFYFLLQHHISSILLNLSCEGFLFKIYGNVSISNCLIACTLMLNLEFSFYIIYVFNKYFLKNLLMSRIILYWKILPELFFILQQFYVTIEQIYLGEIFGAFIVFFVNGGLSIILLRYQVFAVKKLKKKGWLHPET